jgi:hypothetical protein
MNASVDKKPVQPENGAFRKEFSSLNKKQQNFNKVKTYTVDISARRFNIIANSKIEFSLSIFLDLF